MEFFYVNPPLERRGSEKMPNTDHKEFRAVYVCQSRLIQPINKIASHTQYQWHGLSLGKLRKSYNSGILTDWQTDMLIWLYCPQYQNIYFTNFRWAIYVSMQIRVLALYKE